MKRYLAESIGTFALVFAGTAAIVINELNGGVISHVGVALTFGLVVMAMIYSVGDVSGAHLNPAVTLGFWASGRMSRREVAPYVVSQSAGALAASLIVRALFLESQTLGATIPAGRASQSFVLEVLLTSILMFVILGVSTGAKEKGLLAGVAVGGAVALGSLLGGGTRLGCVDESGALPRTRAGEWTRPSSLDLSHGSGARRSPRGRRLSLCAGLGML